MKELDCRGLACPGPVIQVKKNLEGTPPGGTFSILLDSEASVDNVRRFAESRGAQVQARNRGEGITRMTITAPVVTVTSPDGPGRGEDQPRPDSHGLTEEKPPVILIYSDTLGEGDEKLGRILMEGFINTLTEQARFPDRILFMNGGVKLTVEGSPVLKPLKGLTDLGCEILVCGTCLDFFSLKERLSVGTVSNMYDIQRSMLEASSVIRV